MSNKRGRSPAADRSPVSKRGRAGSAANLSNIYCGDGDSLVKEYKRKYSDAKKERDELRRERDQLRKQLEDVTTGRQEREEALRKEADAAYKARDDLQEQVKKLKLERSAARKRVADVEGELASLQLSYHSLEDALQQTIRERDEARANQAMVFTLEDYRGPSIL